LRTLGFAGAGTLESTGPFRAFVVVAQTGGRAAASTCRMRLPTINKASLLHALQ